MRRLERYCQQCVVDGAIDVFLSDWGQAYPDVDVEVQDVDIDDFGMMCTVKLLIDVYERAIRFVLYPDIGSCAAHIYERLWNTAEGV